MATRAFPIAAGDLRHWINLATPSAAGTVDAFGQPTTTAPAVYGTVHAAIDALQGRELYQAQQYISNVSHRVTIRYRTGGPKAGDLVIYKARTFLIQAVLNPEERNYRLDLLCLESNI